MSPGRGAHSWHSGFDLHHLLPRPHRCGGLRHFHCLLSRYGKTFGLDFIKKGKIKIFCFVLSLTLEKVVEGRKFSGVNLLLANTLYC